MGFEVELKFRVEDHGGVTRLLAQRGVLAGPPTAQDDIYLSHPARDFAQTDEALRLRRDGESNHVTYKGPKHGGPTKTREELEIGFSDGPEARADFLTLFDRLGFRAILDVRKTRLTFRLLHGGRPMTVALDRVDGLGSFAEVETIALSDGDLPAAQAAVLELAAVLGLTDIERRSYLRMALERHQAGGDGPGSGSPAGPA
jgi:adenylate cyclase class 2